MFTTETSRYPALPRTDPIPARVVAEPDACELVAQLLVEAVREIDAEEAAQPWRLPHNACPQCKRATEVLVEDGELQMVCGQCAANNAAFDDHCLRMSRAD